MHVNVCTRRLYGDSCTVCLTGYKTEEVNGSPTFLSPHFNSLLEVREMTEREHEWESESKGKGRREEKERESEGAGRLAHQ